MGKKWKQWQTLFSWTSISLQMVASAMKLKDACSLEEKPRQTYQWASEVTQSCPALCDPMDCGLPGSSIHGIFQARVLEWVAISFSRGSSQPRDQTQVFCTAGWHFTSELLRKSILKNRDIILPTKICIVKAMVFSVIMYGCESWTLKKAKPWRTDAFKLWC